MAEETVFDHFDYYLKFAKPLVLNLPDPKDRVLAAAWIKRLGNESIGSEDVRKNYLKLLLFELHKRRLFGIFLEHPDNVKTLEDFSEFEKILSAAKEIIQKDEDDHKKRFLRGLGGGDYPTYSVEYSADLLEYAAAQDIPKFGVQGYYAFSFEPINTWDNVENVTFPQGIVEPETLEKSLASATSSPAISEKSSSPKSSPKSPKLTSPKRASPLKPAENIEKHPSPVKDKIETPSSPASKPAGSPVSSPASSPTRPPGTPGTPKSPFPPKSPLSTRRSPSPISPRTPVMPKSPKSPVAEFSPVIPISPDRPMSPQVPYELGSFGSPGSPTGSPKRMPVTWGSNLIDVEEPPERDYILDLIAARAGDSFGALDDILLDSTLNESMFSESSYKSTPRSMNISQAPSLPYMTPVRDSFGESLNASQIAGTPARTSPRRELDISQAPSLPYMTPVRDSFGESLNASQRNLMDISQAPSLPYRTPPRRLTQQEIEDQHYASLFAEQILGSAGINISAGSQEGRDIVAEANQTLEDSVTEDDFVDKYAGHKRKDMPVTPPAFSRYKQIREGPAAEVTFSPHEFGIEDPGIFQDASNIPIEPEPAVPIVPKPSRLPFKPKQKPLKKVFPGVDAEDWSQMFFDAQQPVLASDEELEESDDSLPIVPSEDLGRRIDRLEEDISERYDESPAASGISATSPRTIRTPRRGHTLEKEFPLFTEAMPEYFSPEKTPTDRAREQYEMIMESPTARRRSPSPKKSPIKPQNLFEDMTDEGFDLPDIIVPPSPPRDISLSPQRSSPKKIDKAVPEEEGEAASKQKPSPKATKKLPQNEEEVQEVVHEQLAALYESLIAEPEEPERAQDTFQSPTVKSPRSPRESPARPSPQDLRKTPPSTPTQRSPQRAVEFSPRTPTRTSPSRSPIRVPGWQTPPTPERFPSSLLHQAADEYNIGDLELPDIYQSPTQKLSRSPPRSPEQLPTSDVTTENFPDMTNERLRQLLRRTPPKGPEAFEFDDEYVEPEEDPFQELSQLDDSVDAIIDLVEAHEIIPYIRKPRLSYVPSSRGTPTVSTLYEDDEELSPRRVPTPQNRNQFSPRFTQASPKPMSPYGSPVKIPMEPHKRITLEFEDSPGTKEIEESIEEMVDELEESYGALPNVEGTSDVFESTPEFVPEIDEAYQPSPIKLPSPQPQQELPYFDFQGKVEEFLPQYKPFQLPPRKPISEALLEPLPIPRYPSNMFDPDKVSNVHSPKALDVTPPLLDVSPPLLDITPPYPRASPRRVSPASQAQKLRSVMASPPTPKMEEIQEGIASHKRPLFDKGFSKPFMYVGKRPIYGKPAYKLGGLERVEEVPEHGERDTSYHQTSVIEEVEDYGMSPTPKRHLTRSEVRRQWKEARPKVRRKIDFGPDPMSPDSKTVVDLLKEFGTLPPAPEEEEDEPVPVDISKEFLEPWEEKEEIPKFTPKSFKKFEVPKRKAYVPDDRDIDDFILKSKQQMSALEEEIITDPFESLLEDTPKHKTPQRKSPQRGVVDGRSSPRSPEIVNMPIPEHLRYPGFEYTLRSPQPGPSRRQVTPPYYRTIVTTKTKKSPSGTKTTTTSRTEPVTHLDELPRPMERSHLSDTTQQSLPGSPPVAFPPSPESPLEMFTDSPQQRYTPERRPTSYSPQSQRAEEEARKVVALAEAQFAALMLADEAPMTPKQKTKRETDSEFRTPPRQIGVSLPKVFQRDLSGRMLAREGIPEEIFATSPSYKYETPQRPQPQQPIPEERSLERSTERPYQPMEEHEWLQIMDVGETPKGYYTAFYDELRSPSPPPRPPTPPAPPAVPTPPPAKPQKVKKQEARPKKGPRLTKSAQLRQKAQEEKLAKEKAALLKKKKSKTKVKKQKKPPEPPKPEEIVEEPMLEKLEMVQEALDEVRDMIMKKESPKVPFMEGPVVSRVEELVADISVTDGYVSPPSTPRSPIQLSSPKWSPVIPGRVYGEGILEEDDFYEPGSPKASPGRSPVRSPYTSPVRSPVMSPSRRSPMDMEDMEYDDDFDADQFEDAENLYDEGLPDEQDLFQEQQSSPVPTREPSPRRSPMSPGTMAEIAGFKHDLERHEYTEHHYDYDRRHMVKRVRSGSKTVKLGKKKPGLPVIADTEEPSPTPPRRSPVSVPEDVFVRFTPPRNYDPESEGERIRRIAEAQMADLMYASPVREQPPVDNIGFDDEEIHVMDRPRPIGEILQLPPGLADEYAQEFASPPRTNIVEQSLPYRPPADVDIQEMFHGTVNEVEDQPFLNINYGHYDTSVDLNEPVSPPARLYYSPTREDGDLGYLFEEPEWESGEVQSPILGSPRTPRSPRTPPSQRSPRSTGVPLSPTNIFADMPTRRTPTPLTPQRRSPELPRVISPSTNEDLANLEFQSDVIMHQYTPEFHDVDRNLMVRKIRSGKKVVTLGSRQPSLSPIQESPRSPHFTPQRPSPYRQTPSRQSPTAQYERSPSYLSPQRSASPRLQRSIIEIEEEYDDDDQLPQERTSPVPEPVYYLPPEFEQSPERKNYVQVHTERTPTRERTSPVQQMRQTPTTIIEEIEEEVSLTPSSSDEELDYDFGDLTWFEGNVEPAIHDTSDIPEEIEEDEGDFSWIG